MQIYETINSYINYSFLNINNINNFIISIMDYQNKEQKTKTLEKMKQYIGLKFYDQYKMYCYRKGISIS